MSKKKMVFAFMIVVGIVSLVLWRVNHRELTKNQTSMKEKQAVEITPEQALFSQAQSVENIETTVTPEKVLNLDTTPQPQTTLVEDALAIELAEQITDEIFEEARSLIDNPVHSGRIKLQKQMQQETTQESFVHLTDNDNFLMLMPVMAGVPFSAGYCASDVKMTSKMTRVRKLLADAQKDPESVSSFLQEQLSTMLDNFPSVYEEHIQLQRKHDAAGDTKIIYEELPDVDKYRLLSNTAIYVLSEINAYDSLPLLAKLSTQGKRHQSSDFAGSCVVHPNFLLFAMYKLVKEFPEDGLSKEAQAAREKCLTMAERVGIPDPQKIEVAAWNAHYQEDDFRKRAPWVKLYTKNQPTIEVTEFPSLSNLGQRKTEILLARMGIFIDAAFSG